MVKRFSGILNKDDREQDVLAPHHISATNGRFYGGQNGLTFENVKGNYLIQNASLPPGENECNGAFYDQVKKRIIWFNWNQYGNDGIYQLDIQTETVSKIFLCGTDSATNILNLSLDSPVTSVAIVYRPQGDGDLMYWTNGSGRPAYINLDTVSALAPFTSDMINAAKNVPLLPPTCEYANDLTNNVNNLRKKLFRFSQRWVYKNGEKSTFSPISKVPLPVDGYDPNTQTDQTLNNNIVITVTAGGDDYKAIELAGQVNINNTWSDFFLIDSLDRDDYSIIPGATYEYAFYNDSSYTTISVDETDLYFDWLPDKANALELLNGNVLIYSGITDGYDRISREDVDVVITTGASNGQNPDSPSISYSTVSQREIIIQVGNFIETGAIYHVGFNYYDPWPTLTGTISVNYTTIGGDTQNSIASSLAALISNATITATNIGSGQIRVEILTGTNPSLGEIDLYVTSASSVGDASSSWMWGYRGRLGLMYFDDRGKTNGVVSFPYSDTATGNSDFSFTTPGFSTVANVPQIPFVSASLNSLPPSWAKSYQWVRTNNLPVSFIQFITNDFQSDTDYLYFCIENLTYQKTKDTGFIPSYEFSPGDRMLAMASYSGGNYNPYSVQQDFEILGTVRRTMTTPAVDGTFIKVAKPSSLPFMGYSVYSFIQIYTPAPVIKENENFFYEWGEKYDIYEDGGIRYHRGQLQDQTASQPATFKWYDGDVYYKSRRFYPVVNSAATSVEFMMDANYSDYFASAVNSNGRAWVIDENAKQEYNGVLSRWGGQFQSGTNINRLNRFRPNDYDEADRSKGDIRRLKVRDRILRVFQDRGVGQYGVYARFIQNNEGQSDLVTTNEIITSNNIQYYRGTYGLCGYATNLCSSPLADYFVDVITGREIRLSFDGLTDLGLLYKGQFYFSSLAVLYNKEVTRSNGAVAKVMKFWDSFEGESHTILQPGSVNGQSVLGSHYSFNEMRNGFCCDSYSYMPDWAISADDVIYSWYQGRLYKHAVNGSNYCQFYGQNYGCDITLVFNENLIQKKTWKSITEIASDTWGCPYIYTNVIEYGSQRQETNLNPSEFIKLEGNPSASIKRSTVSNGGKVNGSHMKGNWVAIKFNKENAQNLINLSEVSVSFVDSPLTTK